MLRLNGRPELPAADGVDAVAPGDGGFQPHGQSFGKKSDDIRDVAFARAVRSDQSCQCTQVYPEIGAEAPIIAHLDRCNHNAC